MVVLREQVEQRLVEALPAEVLEGQRELEVLQAQEGLPVQELLRQARLGQLLAQFLLQGQRLLERELSGWSELRW